VHGGFKQIKMILVLKTVFTGNDVFGAPMLQQGEPMSAQLQMRKLASQQLQADRLIVATNRGPVEYYLSQDNELKYRRGAGGMVTALLETGNRMEVTWVAMAMTEGDRLALEARQHAGLLPSPVRSQQMQLHYVAVPRAVYEKYYEKISNRVLWFLQHYMHDPSAAAPARWLQDAWTNGYTVANKAIAEAVNREIEREEGSAAVMLHDYHLYLAPRMIRQRHPQVVMQQFIHIPWPEVRCWHFLPSNIVGDIYRGLLGNDLIGFQTQRDAHNFLEGAQSLLADADVDVEEGTVAWRGQLTRVRTYPISVSVEGERRLVQSAAGRRAAEQIRPLLRENTIMRVDRIEPTKNILRGFQAYAQMLDEHPELRGKVAFLAFLVPSRQAIPQYKRYAHEVLKIIEDINAKYGTDEWRPVHALWGNDRTRALAALQFYDVLLVNPIIDGMNLVAKEGLVVNQRNGVLVLSPTAGAFQQLAKASIATSPADVAETAQALYRALTLAPADRRAKAMLGRQIVERDDLNAWFTHQIRDVNAVRNKRAFSLSLVEELAPPALTASVI
jgi:trehalose 6-phosphate synthase